MHHPSVVVHLHIVSVAHVVSAEALVPVVQPELNAEEVLVPVDGAGLPASREQLALLKDRKARSCLSLSSPPQSWRWEAWSRPRSGSWEAAVVRNWCLPMGLQLQEDPGKLYSALLTAPVLGLELEPMLAPILARHGICP